MSTLVAEHDNSSLKKSTLNTITAASAVGELSMLIAGADCQVAAAAAAGVAGVRAVIVADGDAYLNQLPEAVAPLESGIRRLYASVCCSHYGRKEFDARGSVLMSVRYQILLK